MKNSIILGLLLLLPLLAKPQTYRNEFQKTFKVRANTTVEVTNKYGKIHVVTWEKDSVKFEVEVEMESTSNSKLERLKKTVDFDFTNTEFFVSAKTEFVNARNSVIADLLDMATQIIPSDKVEVDYKIYLPKQATIKINNRFGDVYIDDFGGNINLSLSNGDLKANRLKGNSEISLSSGDAVINYLKDGNLLVSYSDFHVKDADRINIDSKSSRIYLDNVNYLKAVSRRDKMFIRKTTDFFGDSYFSDFSIEKLQREANYSFKDGSLSLERVVKGFSFLNINSEYTDIDLVFDREASYDIDIIHSDEVTLMYPPEFGELEKQNIGEEDQEILLFGQVGKSNGNSKVKITATRKCFINIYHK
jgi:hypothetical protein